MGARGFLQGLQPARLKEVGPQAIENKIFNTFFQYFSFFKRYVCLTPPIHARGGLCVKY